jgi:hypothetical protein
MRPTITLTVTPTSDSDYARVTVVTTITDEWGADHDVILYDQLRVVKPLRETETIEWWTLGELAANAYAATGAIISLINGGSATLMADRANH